ncbi:peptidoglycan DD-metalloendopeptidase family protein [Nitratireductor basaltis]|uniref:Peptidase M23 n=1 Tax=Nitratireductor basaltis TaxID=472175 RepID=A0A084UAA1_9HYPH|nr:peptidoglycan DD-metalloendopeptidase family protein [Nitratireductor basaltis]KFB09887.1 Peptidase M23 [Nitratireductor basaltis]
MFLGITGHLSRTLARGVAVCVVGGTVVGCGSAANLTDGLVTNSTAQATSYAPANQPYPGDVAHTTRRSAGRPGMKIVRPSLPVGGGGILQNRAVANLPSPSTAQQPVYTAAAARNSTVTSQPLPAPQSVQAQPAPQQVASAASATMPAPAQAAPANIDSRSTGSVATAATTTVASAATRRITVSEGDTLYGLARRFNVPVSALMSANGMSEPRGLMIGQTLVIPGAGAATAPAPAAVASKKPVPEPEQRPQIQAVASVPSKPEPVAKAPAEATASSDQGRYTVVAGDTLYGVARKTGASVDAIKQANGLGDGVIRIGQTLNIPNGSGSVVAANAGVDPVKTATTVKPKEVESDSSAQVAAYTPPKITDDVAKKAESDAQTAALTPQSTGVDRLRWPVRGRVITSYGAGAGGRSSDGVDIAVPQGTSVRAAENGIVIYAGDGLKGFGNTVLVRHENELVTVYGHTSDIRVKRGEKVKRGQEIALSGMSGDADRPKLHFEVRKGTNPVDPMQFLE